MSKQWHLLSSLTQTRFDIKSERMVDLDSRCAVRELSDDVRELLTDVSCRVDSRCAMVLVVFCQIYFDARASVPESVRITV